MKENIGRKVRMNQVILIMAPHIVQYYIFILFEILNESARFSNKYWIQHMAIAPVTPQMGPGYSNTVNKVQESRCQKQNI